MDAVLLARIQFAFTICFHYIFPQLTIGLAWLIFYIMTRYRRTGDEVYRVMARFWIRVFALIFVVGVGTGIVMEFQFGTNWADYSRFVGDIFGAPLAAEAILAFFMESVFLGLLVFGEKRLSSGMHWLSSLMVAFGATLSAFWIVVANSWQQTPAGYEMVNGRPVLADFWAAVFNPSTVERFLHTVDGVFVSSAMFMLGIAAYYLLKKQHLDFAKRSFKIALVVGFIASMLQVVTGHYHAVQVTKTQPAKLAAFEGLFETQTRAPLLLFGIPNYEEERTDLAIEVPAMLSIMIAFDADVEVQGLKDFPKEDWPPLGLTFFPFHLMVGLGFYFVGMTGLGILLLWRKVLFQGKLYDSLYYVLAVVTIPLPILANELGWICAEVGRQPWIVYNLLRTADAISVAVPAYQVLLSLILFGLIYAFMFFTWLFLLWRIIKKGPEAIEAATEGEVPA